VDWSVVLPPVGLGSGWALVALTVVALMRGKLVPRSSLDDAFHDRDEWRAESRIKDAQLAEKDVQLGHLAEVGRTTEALLAAYQRTREAGA
jgi:hypothetical protein